VKIFVLHPDFNRHLWDEAAGAYGAAVGPSEILPEDRMFRKSIDLKSANGLTEPTLHANLFALDRGLVPPERRDRVVSWVLRHEDQIRQIMANHYFFKLLCSLDEPRYDRKVLDRIRGGWRKMIDSPWQTTWEAPDGGSKMHCYGIVPAHTLSTYVLGVRRDAPVAERKILIEPHLGDLTEASGTVVTEFGPVTVSWKKSDAQCRFEIEVPQDVEATLAVPVSAGQESIRLNGSEQPDTRQGGRLLCELRPGKQHGSF
jgi:alpha-L-rhamnosidase